MRIQYEGALYHITCRGNEKRNIFKDDSDRVRFLEILQHSVDTYRIILYCYVLMENHYHLMVETPLGNLSEFMRHFNITYTSYYNRRHDRVGHLYQGRYKSILIDREGYLTIVSRYIHLNPIRVKNAVNWSVSEKEKYLKEYPWSSLVGYKNEEKRLPFINYGLVLAEYGGDNPKGRAHYWREIRRDIAGELHIKDKVIGQSIFGGDEFIRWVRGNFVHEGDDREVPPLKEILKYTSKDAILQVISDETSKGVEEILSKRGVLRQMAMELLYKHGGLKGVDIGKMMGLDYSTVSQGRKRFKERLERDKGIKGLMERIEWKLSRIKI